MRANWGLSIIIAFAVFITFIMYFVFKVQGDMKYDHQMVTEDYYKKELGYQKQLDSQQHANNLLEKLIITTKSEGVVIIFPKSFDYNKISGKVSFYRPSNQQEDFDMPISLSSSNLLIPKIKLMGGRWDISVEWSYQGVDYLNKEKVNL